MNVYLSFVLLIPSGVVANASLLDLESETRDGSTAGLFREIQSYLENNNDPDDFDADEILNIFDGQGFDGSFLVDDSSSTILSALKFIASLISGSKFAKILKSTLAGKPTTTSYSPYMLAFQIDCYYEGFQKGPVKAALSAYDKYNGYGCYCGSGHAPNSKPTDAVDSCCKIHDSCYSSASSKYKLKQGCDTYSTDYNATCCLQKTTICNDAGPSAARDICLCDQAMAFCVNVPTTAKAYDKSNKNARKKGKCGTGGTNSKPLSIWSIFTSCSNTSRRRAAVRNKSRYRPPTCQTRSG